ncbi:unnamed protein product [Echinostoma caproni]|uniref:GIY-YIG domain-containing protein n=1 Tax=Echinostoma caproni TaxID=27848 RepID=A0A183AG10_9TREM|nr:unnamed protein product [Echinostoma caproni]
MHNAASLIILYKSRRMIMESNLDKLNSQVISSCVYLFQGTCVSKYIGRTGRRLAPRISAHVPGNLALNGSKILSNSIGRHILDCKFCTDPKQAFRVLKQAKTGRLLRFAEAKAIRRHKSDLYMQLELVATLTLSW